MKKNAAARTIREMRMNSSKTSAVAVFTRDRRSLDKLITTLSFGEARGRSFARSYRRLAAGESALRCTSEENQTCVTGSGIAEIHRSGLALCTLAAHSAA